MSNKPDKRLVQQYEANERYRCKMKAAGMVQIRVWVPATEKARVKKFALGLRGPGQFL